MMKKSGFERCKIGEMAEMDLTDHLERYRFASKYVSGKVVLDIACGTGYGTELLKEAGAKSVTGVDISKKAINDASQKHKISGVNFIEGSIIDFSESIKYDLIVSFETIEHVEDYKSALNNLKSLLNEDGILIISTPNRTVNSPQCCSIDDKPGGLYHVREFTFDEFENTLTTSGYETLGKYGQKQRKLIKNRYIFAFYYILSSKLKLLGNYHFKPEVLPQRDGLEPRYTVIVCKKK
ncbi:MAG: class I SAM-dependent methyltransferase [Nitrospiria bacterium]